MIDTLSNAASRRRPWVAVLLSVITTGLGQIYAGRLTRGLVVMLIGGISIPVLAGMLTLRSKADAWGLMAVMVSFVAVVIVAAIDSFLVARRARPDYELKEYNRWYVYLLLLLIGTGGNMLLALQARSKVVEAFIVPSHSMSPMILYGDRVLANKRAYTTEDPRRGDIIVFAARDNRRQTYIKRVVAIAGDTVQIAGGALYVNDRLLPQQQVDASRLSLVQRQLEGTIHREVNDGAEYRILLGPVAEGLATDLTRSTVPGDHVFCLGDNRNASKDSRHFGPVPVATIKGRADYLYWPAVDWSRFGRLDHK